MNSRIMILSIILFFQCGNIQQIQNLVERIDLDQSKYIVKEFRDADLYFDSENNNRSIEGQKVNNVAIINLRLLQEGEELKKITVDFNGEKSDLISEYYCCDGKLAFAKRLMKTYSLPKWHDDFDSKKFNIVENIYFMSNEKVVKWITDGEEKIDNIKEEERVVLNDFNIYKNYSE